MAAVGEFFAFTLSLFRIQFSLFGFTLSYWEVLLWSMVATLLIWFLKEVMR